MISVRFIDPVGNRHDVQVEFLPRIGDLVTEDYGVGGQPVTTHYFRVKDVEHRIDRDEARVRVLLEDTNETIWPS